MNCEKVDTGANDVERREEESEVKESFENTKNELARRDEYKLYVANLKTWMTQKEAVKFFTKHSIPGIKSVKKQRGKPWGFVVFNSIEEKDQAEPLICAIEVEGKLLKTKAPAERIRGDKRERNDEKGTNEGFQKKGKTGVPSAEELENKSTNDVVAPWYNKPYPEQLELKEKEMRQVLKRCCRRLLKRERIRIASPPEKPKRAGSVKELCHQFSEKGSCMYGERCKFLHMSLEEFTKMKEEEIKEEEEKEEEEEKVIPPSSYQHTGPDEGQMCPMLPILSYERKDGYRNKCSFTIGKDCNNKPCIGFRMGSFIDGNVIIGRTADVVVVPPIMKHVVELCEQFILSKPYETYDMCKHTGFWRNLLLRYSERTDQLCFLMIVGNPYEASLPNAEEAYTKVTELVEKEIESVMRDLYSALHESVTCIASFSYQIYTGLSNPDSACPLHLVQGTSFIEEKLFDLTFRISPYAFFQVNTPVAEILYKNIGDWLSIQENTLLLDVCCGTGTIGISLANRVNYVIGVDIESAAIEDAKVNATINHISNIEFICSPAEKVMTSLLTDGKATQYQHIVVVVDPARGGLHKDIITACRRCPAITELIYVSCNPTGSFIENTIGLCCNTDRKNPGKPFYGKKSQPVDLFPHTEHCELMTLFSHSI